MDCDRPNQVDRKKHRGRGSLFGTGLAAAGVWFSLPEEGSML